MVNIPTNNTRVCRNIVKESDVFMFFITDAATVWHYALIVTGLSHIWLFYGIILKLWRHLSQIQLFGGIILQLWRHLSQIQLVCGVILQLWRHLSQIQLVCGIILQLGGITDAPTLWQQKRCCEADVYIPYHKFAFFQASCCCCERNVYISYHGCVYFEGSYC